MIEGIGFVIARSRGKLTMHVIPLHCLYTFHVVFLGKIVLQYLSLIRSIEWFTKDCPMEGSKHMQQCLKLLWVVFLFQLII